MIYPTNNFKQDWYSAQKFGNPTTYGFHEGEDLSLKTGGDSDLGQELKSIAKGRIVYYHYSSHPTYVLGRHLAVKIDGAWGTRWVHYSHCDANGFLGSVQDVSEGQVIARVGKSGTPYAHCHFSIFKVDPATIGGIDVFAKTQEQLNNWWEDPMAFMDKWMAPSPEPCVITDQTKIPSIDNMEVQQIRSLLGDRLNTINNQQAQINS